MLKLLRASDWASYRQNVVFFIFPAGLPKLYRFFELRADISFADLEHGAVTSRERATSSLAVNPKP